MYNSAFDGRPAPGPVWPHCRESDEINCTKHSDVDFFEVFAFKKLSVLNTSNFSSHNHLQNMKMSGFMFALHKPQWLGGAGIDAAVFQWAIVCSLSPPRQGQAQAEYNYRRCKGCSQGLQGLKQSLTTLVQCWPNWGTEEQVKTFMKAGVEIL